jgi:dolichol-phosphate mannosyltransferase
MTSDRVRRVCVSSDNERELPLAHPKLGVVIPLANEEATVEQLLQRVLAQLGPLDRIFCILDGKSQDRTMALVRGVSSLDPRVVAVWAPENRCVVDAYFRGFRDALAAGCDWVLEMDGGLSHCPEEIPRFLDALGKGADFAAGSRFIRGGSYQGRWSRRLLSRGGTLLANLLLGTGMKDMTSGFECYSRRALSRVVERGVRSRAHFFQTEIRYMLHDWSWVEVPITYCNPSTSVGKATILESVRLLLRLAWEARGKSGKMRPS